MVLLTISKKVTSVLGPVLFRSGLTARNLFKQHKDSPYLDMAFLLPYSQKLISLAIDDQSRKTVSKAYEYARQSKQPTNMIQALFTNKDNSPKAAMEDDEQASSISISDLRVQVYNEKIRPTLLPNECWSDINRWRWNIRVMKWARTEFLISKHGPAVKEALDAYPQLRASPQFTRHPTHTMLLNLARGRIVLGSDEDGESKRVVLPSSETLIKAFGMRKWAKEKNSRRLKETMVPIVKSLGGQLAVQGDNGMVLADIPDSTDLSDTSIEDIFEVVMGGHVKSCGPFNAICEEANMYQMWTKEYVQHLGDYLLQSYCQNNSKATTTIVDIGAGDGLLMHYLQNYMESRLPKRSSRTKSGILMPKMVSTDDGSWGIFAKASVEKLNVEETLQKYGKAVNSNSDNDDNDHQVIVLCSWMPQMVDWTALFRESGVDEYILIGEADDGSCGHTWETWGNPEFAPRPDSLPSYKGEGYQRWDMDVLSQFQFSRFDCALSRSSKTVSFRRKNKVETKTKR